MSATREDLQKIYNAGIAEVAPDTAIFRHVAVAGNLLEIAGSQWDLSRGKLVVVGAGKGVAPMANAIEKLLGPYISHGCVVTRAGHGLPLQKVELCEAAHPVPDTSGLVSSKRILALANSLTSDDILLVLLTGGASALTPAPAFDLALEDLQAVTAALLASGAAIDEINAIRRHLSCFGGGRLARAANGATVISLIISDVPGDNLAAIGSGPTAPDLTTFEDCLTIVARYRLAKRLPAKVLEILELGAAGKLAETLKADDPLFERVHNFLIANNAQALAACARKAVTLGYEPRVIIRPFQGEARDIAKILCRQALEISESLAPDAKPVCLLAGGETTVRLRGSGLGGRNQEMALTAALELENHDQIAALFAGTDGTDGPTNAAGGFVFADTAAKIGKHADCFLAANNSNRALAMAGELFTTGPTLTNVMDLAIILIWPKLSGYPHGT